MLEIPSIYKEISPGKSLFYTWFEAMHTRIDLVFCHLSEESCKQLREEIIQELSRLEKILNRFDPESELSIVNKTAAKEKVIISDELSGIICSCLDYRTKTFEYFDISVHKNSPFGDADAIEISGNTITLSHPGVQLDLGGYAKGYALDNCKKIIEKYGCKDSLLSFGNSSVLAIGDHPVGNGWKISLAKSATNNSPEDILLFDECLSTSGNSIEKMHIYSPLSGKYVEAGNPVSVKTKTGTTGEVLSTALFIAQADHSSPDIISSIFANFPDAEFIQNSIK